MALPFPHPSALLPPGFTMSRAAPEDTEAMTDVWYIRAFTSSPGFTYWWSAPAVMRAWNADRIRARFADPRVQQFKVVATDADADSASGGRLVAFAKWDVPAAPVVTGLSRGLTVYDELGRPTTTATVVADGADGAEGGDGKGGEGREGGEVGGEGEVKKYVLRKPEGVDQVVFDELFGGLARMQEKWRASEKLGLGIICTDPSYHGRGIGAALIESVLAVADAEQIPTYLEALPLAMPLYQRQGFVQVDTLEFGGGRPGHEQKLAITIMIREPKPAA